MFAEAIEDAKSMARTTAEKYGHGKKLGTL